MNIQRDLFGARIGEYALPTRPQTEKCRSCEASIIWVVTPRGKAMPLSLATVETRDGVKFAMPHFVDCPDAKKWSKA